jgi:type VI secretion system secreted protein Hcp
MNLTAFLKIEDIPGESQAVEHEDEIDVHGLQWGVERSAPAQIGRGRARSRADVSPVRVQKFMDASSVYLAEACARSKSFDEAVIAVRKDSGEAHLDYLVITMENVVITEYEVFSGEADNPDPRLAEEVTIDFEKVTLKYIQQAEDGSAGDEHEVELQG